MVCTSAARRLRRTKYFNPGEHHGRADATAAFGASLDRLGFAANPAMFTTPEEHARTISFLGSL